eukprot:2026328-Ditylum_brightwellii.AAC.1
MTFSGEFYAALDSLEKIWHTNGLSKPSFWWFPTAKLDVPRGRLLHQKYAAGQSLLFEKSLFGLQMHNGTDGSFSDSKTEADFFPSTSHPIKLHNLSPVYVTSMGYVTYCNKFKYLGSYIMQNLCDTYD